MTAHRTSDELIHQLASALRRGGLGPQDASRAAALLQEGQPDLEEMTTWIVRHERELGLRDLLRQIAVPEAARKSAVRTALRHLAQHHIEQSRRRQPAMA